MILGLILAAVLATDAAVIALFLVVRSSRTATSAARNPMEMPADIEEMVNRLRMQTEQAAAELGRQKAELRRMLASAEVKTGASGSRPNPVASESVLRMANQGMAPRAIAGRTRVSEEEIRLLLARESPRASA
jgi:hypothetical protein